MSKKVKWPKGILGIDVPLYGGELYLIKTIEEYNQCLAYLDVKEVIDDCVGYAMMLQNTDGGVIYLVGVFNDNPRTLVHELAHITFYILGRAGVNVTEGDDNEAFCYLQMDLFEKCIETYR